MASGDLTVLDRSDDVPPLPMNGMNEARNMIERVALALWQAKNPSAHRGMYDWCCRLPLTGAGFKAEWEDMARAAIEAMREAAPELDAG